MQLIRTDSAYLAADTPYGRMALMHDKPRGQNRNQTGCNRDNPKVVPKALQVMQVKVDTRGNCYGQLVRPWHVVNCGSRSEERRVGKEWGSTCRSRWSPGH